jgi:hypothetical protein
MPIVDRYRRFARFRKALHIQNMVVSIERPVAAEGWPLVARGTSG